MCVVCVCVSINTSGQIWVRKECRSTKSEFVPSRKFCLFNSDSINTDVPDYSPLTQTWRQSINTDVQIRHRCTSKECRSRILCFHPSKCENLLNLLPAGSFASLIQSSLKMWQDFSLTDEFLNVKHNSLVVCNSNVSINNLMRCMLILRVIVKGNSVSWTSGKGSGGM